MAVVEPSLHGDKSAAGEEQLHIRTTPASASTSSLVASSIPLLPVLSPAPEVPGIMADEGSSSCSNSLTEEAWMLANRLQQLAGTAAAVAVATGKPPPETRSCGVATDVSAVQIRQWEEAETSLSAMKTNIERLLLQVMASRAQCAEATAAAEAEEQQWAVEVESVATAAPSLAAAYELEAEARRHAETSLEHRAAEAEEEAQKVQALTLVRSEEEEKTVAMLRHELTEAEHRKWRAEAEVEEFARDSTELAAADAASRALVEVQEAEARGDMLEEEHARLKEELGTLRFSLKDMKSFQHRRVQELDAQVQRLERQRRKLETEQSARMRSEEASEAAEAASTETQLLRLQQLNARLTAQVREAQQERELKEQQQADLRVEHGRLRQCEAKEAEEITRAHARLDEAAEKEGAFKREARQLRNQAQMLQRHVTTLDTTASQTCVQLEESEAAHSCLRDELSATERRAEIIRWKLQVAETQLVRPHKSHSWGTMDGAGSASDSAGQALPALPVGQPFARNCSPELQEYP